MSFSDFLLLLGEYLEEKATLLQFRGPKHNGNFLIRSLSPTYSHNQPLSSLSGLLSSLLYFEMTSLELPQNALLPFCLFLWPANPTLSQSFEMTIFFFSRKLNFNDYTCISKSFFNISKFNYSCSFHLLLLCIRRPFFPTYRETEGLVLLQKWELLERLLGPLVKEKGKNWHDSPVFCSWILTQNNNNKQQ